MYYYKNRTYHAELGVFMQADPIGHSGGVNLYAYVGGDPVNFTDPWGLRRIVSTVGCYTTYEQPYRIRDGEGRIIGQGSHTWTVLSTGCTDDFGSGSFDLFGNAMQEMFGHHLEAAGNAVPDHEDLCNIAGSALNAVTLPTGDGGVWGVLTGAEAVIGGGVGGNVGDWYDTSTGEWGAIVVGEISAGFDIDAISGTVFRSARQPSSGVGLQAELGFGPAEGGVSAAISNDGGSLENPTVSGGAATSGGLEFVLPITAVGSITASLVITCGR